MLSRGAAQCMLLDSQRASLHGRQAHACSEHCSTRSCTGTPVGAVAQEDEEVEQGGHAEGAAGPVHAPPHRVHPARVVQVAPVVRCGRLHFITLCFLDSELMLRLSALG